MATGDSSFNAVSSIFGDTVMKGSPSLDKRDALYFELEARIISDMCFPIGELAVNNTHFLHWFPVVASVLVIVLDTKTNEFSLTGRGVVHIMRG